MTDERPRPAYGEYATPEQQAAAMGVHRLEPSAVTPAENTPPNPPPPYGKTVGSRPPVPSAVQRSLLAHKSALAQKSELPQKSELAQPSSRRWDQFLTALLLAYGLWSVISGLTQYANLSTVAQKFYTSQGLGTFSSARPELGTSLGLAINAADLAVFVIVALVAFRLLRRGRVAFWVPLTGGLVTGIIAAACLISYLFTDPSFATYFDHLGA